jgi:hypothetical protein
MTMPDERYRAVQLTEQFLMDLIDPSTTPRVPKPIRQRARSLLRHYPGEYYLALLAEARPDVLARELEGLYKWIKRSEDSVDTSEDH